MYLNHFFQQIILPITENPIVLIFVPLGSAIVVLVLNALRAILSDYKKPIHLRHSRLLKLDIADAFKPGTWNKWVTPYTGLGGMLGIIIVVQTDKMFTDLSILFGAMLLLAPLVSKVIKNWVGILGASALTLWAAFGEFLATVALLMNFQLSSPLITILLWAIVIVAAGLAILYGFQSQRQSVTHAPKRPAKKASAVEEHDVLSDSFVQRPMEGMALPKHHLQKV